VQTEKKASMPEMEAYMARKMFSKPIRVKEETSAYERLSTAKPGSSHVMSA